MGRKERFNKDNDAWNMAQMFLERLDRRSDERDQARIQGDVLSWYRANRSLYTNIFFKIREAGHEEQEEKLEKLFVKASNFLKSVGSDKSVYQLAVTNVENILDEIDRLLNTLMYDYGLIFPKHKLKTYEQIINEEYA